MSYPFVKTDGGRTQSKRPKQTNDCTVRALALVTETPYDTVYDKLKEHGRVCSDGFHLSRWIWGQVDPVLGEPEYVFGYTAYWRPFQAQKGKKRMNPVEFTKTFPQGRYICRTAKHVFAVIDGVVYDAFQERDDRCIYGAWEFVKLPVDKT
jgi:hypothetical protein